MIKRWRWLILAGALFALLTVPAFAAPFGGSINCEGLQGVVCVTDYGADATGANDNAKVIASAMQAATVQGANAVVYFPSGTYKVNSTVTIPASVTFAGQGVSSIIKAGSTLTSDVISGTAAGIGIRDLQVDGNRANLTLPQASPNANGIDLSGSDVTLSNVTVTAAFHDGIKLNGVTRGALSGVTSFANGNHGIDVLGAAVDVSIASSKTYNNGARQFNGGSGDGVRVQGTALRTLVNGLSSDDYQGSATQGWGLNETGSANYTILEGLGSTGTISGTATVAGANSQIIDTGTNLSLTNPKVTGGLNDANGNQEIGFTATTGAVDNLNVANSATPPTSGVLLSAKGTDTNVPLTLNAKGSSAVSIDCQSTYPDCLAVTGTANGAVAPVTLAGTGTDATVQVALQGKGASGFVALASQNADYLAVTGAAAGGKPTLGATGSDATIQLNLNGKGANGSVNLGAQDTDYVTVTPTATGGIPAIGVNGTDTTIALSINGQGGNGSIRLAGQDTDYVVVTGTATGGTPAVGVGGTDTNIPFAIKSQGTGAIGISAQSTDYLSVTGSASANPTLTTAGGSSNTNINLNTSGTGTTLVNGARVVTSSGLTANAPVVATSSGSIKTTAAGSQNQPFLSNGSGAAPAFGAMFTLTTTLAADVNLTNTSNFFDAISVAQGTTGTWLVLGQATVTSNTISDQLWCKVWDGTTVIASGAASDNATQNGFTIPLVGVITNPVANIKISCRDANNTNGLIKANTTGAAKDTTLTVLQIG